MKKKVWLETKPVLWLECLHVWLENGMVKVFEAPRVAGSG